ncbi:MAG: YitT family protein [Succiniclasticum sp.]|nr:YitT family protein [Succiniclasticum sp.]
MANQQLLCKNTLFKVLGLTLGAVIYTAGLDLFLVPNHVIDGGVIGISLMLQHLLGIPFSLLVVLLNLPFFYLGYRRLGRGIAAAATYAIVVVAVCSSFFSRMAPVSIDPLLATIYGGILIGIGVGIVIRCGGSTDGSEILAIVLDNNTSFSVGELVLFMNIFIMGCAGLVFNWNSALYSLMAYFICSRLIDTVSEGLDSSKGIFIITTNFEAVSDAIVHDLHRAVTHLHGQGGFLKDDKDVLYCVVSRLEIQKLKTTVHDIDSQAFLSVFDVREVQGGRVIKRIP